MTKALFSPLQLTSAYPHLFRLLRHSSLPCFPTPASPGHLLERCRWAGETVDCRQLFTPVATDSGICCAFNPRQILRETNCTGQGEDTEYGCLVREIQEEESKNTAKAVRKASFGRKKGLQVILDQHSNLDSPATLFDGDTGFKIYLGKPTNFPMLTSDHLQLSPGQQHTVRLSASHLTSTTGVRHLAVQDRGCLFPHEQPPDHHLEFYSEYSYDTCLFECALTLASSELGCSPWYLPALHNSTMCNPWDAASFTRTLENTPQSSCSHCLPDCEATTYTATTSATPIRQCDSRNLNLNPFCNLQTKLASSPWIGDVNSLYGDNLPDYIKTITSASRPWYGYPEDEIVDVLHEGKVRPVLDPQRLFVPRMSSLTAPWRPTWPSSISTLERRPSWVGRLRNG